MRDEGHPGQYLQQSRPQKYNDRISGHWGTLYFVRPSIGKGCVSVTSVDLGCINFRLAATPDCASSQSDSAY